MSTRNLRKLLTRKKGNAAVLTADEQIQVVHWLGEFKACKDIKKMVKEKFGKDIGLPSIYYYERHPEWAAILEKDRQKFSKQIFRVELANERRRLEELSTIYWKQKDKGELSEAVRTLHEIYEQVQKPQAFIQNNYQMNVYQEMTEDEFEKRELELLQKRRELKEVLDAGKIGSAETTDGDSGTQPVETVQGEQGSFGHESQTTP